ncbi:hypothetical protein FC15_GL000579 [Lapidilactobacillus concavus DSM 17758]|uniref:5-bromo-4-chloroindolyl phosphate hydrolysis protein n=1 Tax=Lapidilactobacillus concavus DSM 17758 TaxID=1423735 RepID=A0A0R1VRZ5_9LACO|nr:5-bromo-4-chloroindolyl phosphate hydrolysis family protein [Lapidilactobacillus concavus]KRM08510.1 hypothetical protein FC15_GL000579 [Lapidilactobacillus concavus DSM 17758]GEL13035.1 hypothetical protein LCO01nite_05840 [Lapidilactobacillus concavus]
MQTKKNTRRLFYVIAVVLILILSSVRVTIQGPRGLVDIAALILTALSTALIVRAITLQGDKRLFRKLMAWSCYFMTGCIILGTLLTVVDLSSDDSLALSIVGLFFAFIAYLFAGVETKARPATESFDAPINNKLLNHYHQAGLSDTDINVFRETMAEAKQEIIDLEKVMTAVPKLRAINLNHDTLEVAKAMFAALVKEPERLQEAADFLYKHLPNSLQIARKYQEINTHEVKTADTYAVLDRSVEVLATLSEQMKHDYTDFVAEDISDLSTTLDAVNHPDQRADFNLKSEQSIAQMQDQLSQIQKDYLTKQQSGADSDAVDHAADAKTDTLKDGDSQND